MADTFYVSDIFGQKITFEEKIEEIRKKLLECLEEEFERIFSISSLNYLTVESGLARNTLDAYGHDLARYLDFLQQENVAGPDAITPTLILRFLAFLKDAGLSARSRARALVAVRSFHKFLLSERIAAANPTAAGRGAEELQSPAAYPALRPRSNACSKRRPARQRSICATGRCSKFSTPPACASPNWLPSRSAICNSMPVI